MARYYIAFSTMQAFQQIESTSNLGDLVVMLSKSEEFTQYGIRMGEKKILNSINQNKEKMRFPIKGKVKTVADKVNCLIQVRVFRFFNTGS